MRKGLSKKEQKNYDISRGIIEKAGKAYDDGSLEEAIKLYEEAFEYYATTGDILEYVMMKMESGEKDKALDLINEVIGMNEEDFRGFYFRGSFYENQDNDEEALKDYLKAYELIKDMELSKEYGVIPFKIGRIYDDLSDKEKDKKDEYLDLAKKYYNITLKIDINHYYANLNLGSIYEKENKLDEALELLLRANSIDKDEKMSAYNLGVVYSKLKDYDKAVKYYLEEISKKEFYPFAYYNLAIIYKDIYNDYLKAKEYYIEGLKYLKKDASLWYNLGCTYVLLGDFKNATDCFYCSINLNPAILGFLEEDKEVSTYVINKEFKNLQNKLKCN